MTNYYVTLLSGASAQQYENTSNKFTNKLPIPLQLDDDNMEFGLCELSYVRNFDNVEYIKNGLAIFDFLNKNEINDNILEVTFGQIYSCNILKGYYKNPNAICKSLNALIWDKVARLKYRAIINYDEPTRKFVINTDGVYISLLFEHSLALLLGITEREYKKGERFIIGESKQGDGYKYKGELRNYSDSNLRWKGGNGGLQKYESKLRTTDTILIYCDLVLQQFSGDTFSNLLRMCPVTGEDNQRIIERFEKIHYVPVSKRHVTAIEIHIKTIDDSFFHLKDLTYVKLHFRKRKS